MSENIIGIGLVLVLILVILEVGMLSICIHLETIKKLIEKALREKENV